MFSKYLGPPFLEKVPYIGRGLREIWLGGGASVGEFRGLFRV